MTFISSGINLNFQSQTQLKNHKISKKSDSHSPDPSLKVPPNHASLVDHACYRNQPQADNSNPQAK